MKTVSRIIQSIFYIYAGYNHFRIPKFYLRLMPPYLPEPELLNYLSGAIEIGLGVLLFFPRFSKKAAWGIIALLIAVFPANWYHFRSGGAGMDVPQWGLIVRLPFQLVFMVWAYWHTKD